MADLFGGGAPLAAQSSAPSIGGGLNDLLGTSGGLGGGFGDSLATSESATPSSSSFPDAIVYNKDGVNITFAFQKNPSNLAHTLVQPCGFNFY